MATHIGRDGVIKVGGTLGADDGTVVAHVRSFSVEETGDTVEYTVMGNSARVFLPTLTSFSASCDVYWDEDDSGQQALTVNSVVILKLYPEGESAAIVDPAEDADKYYYGTATVTGVSKSASFDGMVEASMTFQGTGVLTIASAT
jgi:hypothetical protein